MLGCAVKVKQADFSAALQADRAVHLLARPDTSLLLRLKPCSSMLLQMLGPSHRVSGVQACKAVADAIPSSTRLQVLDLRRNCDSEAVRPMFAAVPDTLAVLL